MVTTLESSRRSWCAFTVAMAGFTLYGALNALAHTIHLAKQLGESATTAGLAGATVAAVLVLAIATVLLLAWTGRPMSAVVWALVAISLVTAAAPGIASYVIFGEMPSSDFLFVASVPGIVAVAALAFVKLEPQNDTAD